MTEVEADIEDVAGDDLSWDGDVVPVGVKLGST